ncbi:MAG: DedA family protein [Planctomycetota bacterium]
MSEFLLNYGYLGIVAFLALCGVGLPIPEEGPIVLAGVLSSQGTLEPWFAFCACLGGALLGDSVMYAIGRHLGHGWLTRHKSVARFIDADKEEKFEHAVRRHGFKVLLLTRFLVGVRGPVYYAAGAAKVPYLRFLAWDTIGATIVVGAVFGLAYRFGEPIARMVHNAEEALTVLVLLALAGVGLVAVYKKQTRRMAAALEDIAEHDAEEAARQQTAAAPTDPRDADDVADATGASRPTAHESVNGSEHAASSNGHAAEGHADAETSQQSSESKVH